MHSGEPSVSKEQVNSCTYDYTSKLLCLPPLLWNLTRMGLFHTVDKRLHSSLLGQLGLTGVFNQSEVHF